MESDSDGFYCMELANGDIIDGADERRSSFCRFINHSVRCAHDTRAISTALRERMSSHGSARNAGAARQLYGD